MKSLALRLKLFCFGFVMAFVGLVKPQKVLDLVYAKQELDELREFKSRVISALNSGNIPT